METAWDCALLREAQVRVRDPGLQRVADLPKAQLSNQDAAARLQEMNASDPLESVYCFECCCCPVCSYRALVMRPLVLHDMSANFC